MAIFSNINKLRGSNSTALNSDTNTQNKRDESRQNTPITLDGVFKKFDTYREDFIKKSNTNIDKQDPLWLTFGIRFDFFPRIGESESLLPGLLTGNARKFLNNRGDTLRVQKLDYFTRQLQKFSIDEPWFFQTLGGVDQLMSFNIEDGGRSIKRKKITIGALETIDMKFMALIDSYRSVIYDKKYMREVLPTNTKRFDMSVYVMDPRNIVKSENGNLEIDNDSQGVIVLKCYDCEFHFDDFSAFIGNLDNADIGKARTHNFSISVGRIYDTYNLPTGVLYGYGGTGYFSEDEKQDYNFLINLVRPQSRPFGEIGNHQKIENEDYQNIIEKRKIKNPETEEENVLEEDEKPSNGTVLDESLFIEEFNNETTINGIEVKENNREIEIQNITPVSANNETEIGEIKITESTNVNRTLNTEILNVVSNKVRTIINE